MEAKYFFQQVKIQIVYILFDSSLNRKKSRYSTNRNMYRELKKKNW